MDKTVFIVEKTSKGFSAYAEDFDHVPVGTTARDMTTLKRNITAALNLYRDHKMLHPVSDKDIVIVE
ncbi:MAG TPA: hypothetical protein VGE90_19255 [Chitinophaga sp.]